MEQEKLDGLVKALSDASVSLEDIKQEDLDGIPLRRDYVQGRIAEKLVEKRLASCRGVTLENQDIISNGYRFVKTARGITVYQGWKSVLEFDFCGNYKGLSFVVEVKSGSLKNRNPIPKLLEYAHSLNGRESALILFFTFYDGRESVVREVEEKYPKKVRCIDLDFKKGEFASTTKHLLDSMKAKRRIKLKEVMQMKHCIGNAI